MSRSRGALLNIFSGILYKLATIGFAVILPRIMILNLGSETNGFISSITSMFVYINLLEAGVGGASTFVLYSSIVKNDRAKTNGIMSATNRYYNKIGVYFLGCITALALIYPVVIKSEMSYLTLFCVTLLTAAPYIFTYFIQGKYTILLSADNKGYILSNINTIISIISNVVKIILLVKGYNIIVVQLSFALISSLQAIFTLIYIKKQYSWLDLSATPDYQSISSRNSVIVHQISGVLFSNSSILLLTLFTDLKIVSIFTVYYMIYSQVGAIPQFVSGGLNASLGQIYNENFRWFKDLFSSFEVYFMQIVYAAFTVAYLLTIPFLRLYTSNITDVNYLDNWLPLLFAISQVLLSFEVPYAILIRVSGHFKQTQIHAVLEATINVVVSLILIFLLGIYGVLLGVIISVFYRCVVTIIYCNRHILNRSYLPYAFDAVLSIGLCILFISILRIQITSYYQLLALAVVLFLALSLILAVKTMLIRRKDSQILFSYLKRLVPKSRQA